LVKFSIFYIVVYIYITPHVRQVIALSCFCIDLAPHLVSLLSYVFKFAMCVEEWSIYFHLDMESSWSIWREVPMLKWLVYAMDPSKYGKLKFLSCFRNFTL